MRTGRNLSEGKQEAGDGSSCRLCICVSLDPRLSAHDIVAVQPAELLLLVMLV